MNRSSAVTKLKPSAGDEPQAGMDAGRPGARRLGIIAAGTALAAFPAGSALGREIEGRLGVILVLAIIAMAAAATASLAMYEARQRTKRTEIECYSVNVIAAATARYIDSTYEPSLSQAGTATTGTSTTIGTEPSEHMANTC